MANRALNLPARREYRSAVVIYHAVVLGMLACLILTIQGVGQRLAPTWRSDYLLPVGLLVCLEGMLTARLVRNDALFTAAWFFHRATEWVVLLALLKLFLYLATNPGQILQDVLLWDEDFINSFFTTPYMVLVAICLFLWTIAGQFTGFLLELEQSLEELDLESQGMVIKDRQRLRRGLEGVIFGIGMLLLVLQAFLHFSIPGLAGSPLDVQSSVRVLLVYFLLGFILLAQSQYFIQRARWYMQNIPASPAIGLRWAATSLGLICLVAALVLALPTGYSAQVFAWLQIAVGAVVGAVVTIVLLMITPVAALIQFLSLLFPTWNLQSPAAPAQPLPAPVDGSEPDMLFLLLKSLLFWTVFFSVIFFSFQYYIAARRGELGRLRMRPGWGWLLAAIDRLRRLFQRDGLAMEAVGGGLVFPWLRDRAPGRRFWERPFGRLPPRTQVLLIYLSMLRWNARRGLPRRSGQTPFEYAEQCAQAAPGAAPAAGLLARFFVEARYTRHPITPADAQAMRQAWEAYREAA